MLSPPRAVQPSIYRTLEGNGEREVIEIKLLDKPIQVCVMLDLHTGKISIPELM